MGCLDRLWGRGLSACTGGLPNMSRARDTFTSVLLAPLLPSFHRFTHPCPVSHVLPLTSALCMVFDLFLSLHVLALPAPLPFLRPLVFPTSLSLLPPLPLASLLLSSLCSRCFLEPSSCSSLFCPYPSIQSSSLPLAIPHRTHPHPFCFIFHRYRFQNTTHLSFHHTFSSFPPSFWAWTLSSI